MVRSAYYVSTASPGNVVVISTVTTVVVSAHSTGSTAPWVSIAEDTEKTFATGKKASWWTFRACWYSPPPPPERREPPALRNRRPSERTGYR